MESCRPRPVDESRSAFYVDVLSRLDSAAIPFLIGGAFAFSRFTGVERPTKDLDVFVRPRDCRAVLRLFARAGFRVDLPFPHWLGKVHGGEDTFIDVIFSSGNGVATVDDLWFVHALDDEVLGLPVRICPPEETIWSKAFIQERERFDGADVLHTILALGSSLDWPRLLMRFGAHWRVLFAHLITFGFVYPDAKHLVPDWVYDELMSRFVAERSEPGEHVCNGTLLSREQYLPDLTRFGFRDGRLIPNGPMTAEEIGIWTRAIHADDE
jgi:hypothetical protein